MSIFTFQSATFRGFGNDGEHHTLKERHPTLHPPPSSEASTSQALSVKGILRPRLESPPPHPTPSFHLSNPFSQGYPKNLLYQVNIADLKAGEIGIHTFITAGQDRVICLNCAIYK